ncbi:MAG TPA: sigma-70 family RNA polymerase sigma factor [Acidobacteriota bacterium]|nr:sigma-70 family RNA polymerase sigma factor [Acidobacteriota bacterium]
MAEKFGDDRTRDMVDHLFRREAGRMAATLTRILGPGQLDLVEDIVQDALVQALRVWPYRGLPDNPRAWLIRVARNRALDRLRRSSTLRGKADDLKKWISQSSGEPGRPRESRFAEELSDDQLAMIFICCHPELPPASRVALTLKTVCGFSVPEIARALLSAQPTVAQRLVRAKRMIKRKNLPFQVPPPAALNQRLDSVLEAVYLLFNEGYAAHSGEELVRRDLTGEALRLISLLSAHPLTSKPQVHALAALLHLHASRLPAREEDGQIVLLADQDRSRWDQRLIEIGSRHLRQAMRARALSRYHLQAAIAACHLAAPSYDQTDWRKILGLYDALIEIQPSPVFRLNRAVALAFVDGVESGLKALQGIEDDPALRDYYLLPATLADLQRRAGRPGRAAGFYRRALKCPCSGPERRFLEDKLEQVEAQSSHAIQEDQP